MTAAEIIDPNDPRVCYHYPLCSNSVEHADKNQGGEMLGIGDRSEEMAFLSDRREELERLYPGRWIAVDGYQLVATASDLTALLEEAVSAGHPDPFITAIPGLPPMPSIDEFLCLKCQAFVGSAGCQEHL